MADAASFALPQDTHSTPPPPTWRSLGNELSFQSLAFPRFDVVQIEIDRRIAVVDKNVTTS